ncbi:MAG: hypothetical protein ACLT98_03505 [Eggerthellaceae bacterium]
MHESADFDIARAIVMNAKTQRTGVCNACESLLVDEAAAKAFLPRMLSELANAGVVVHGDSLARECAAFAEEGGSANVLEHFVDAVEADWGTEYLALEISVKTVGSVEEAIEHINRYGTGHSECIIANTSSEDGKNARTPSAAGVDAAAACERFHALHRRGMLRARCRNRHLYPEAACARPFALEALTSYKYVVRGEGRCAADVCEMQESQTRENQTDSRWYAGVLTIWVAKMPTGHFAGIMEARSTLFISEHLVRRTGARRVRARWRRLHACRRSLDEEGQGRHGRELRYDMVRLAVADNPISTRAVWKSISGGAYTVDTLRVLRAHYPRTWSCTLFRGRCRLQYSEVARFRRNEQACAPCRGHASRIHPQRRAQALYAHACLHSPYVLYRSDRSVHFFH